MRLNLAVHFPQEALVQPVQQDGHMPQQVSPQQPPGRQSPLAQHDAAQFAAGLAAGLAERPARATTNADMILNMSRLLIGPGPLSGRNDELNRKGPTAG